MIKIVMTEKKEPVMMRAECNILADQVGASVGADLAFDDLPPPDVVRWGIRRKAAVVRAIEAQVLSFDAACDRYGLSTEELESWVRRLSTHGVAGLRVTRLTDYRALERGEPQG